MKTTTPIIILIVFLIESFHVIAANESENSFGKNSPVTFIKNEGQWIPEIVYKGSSTGTSVSLLNDGAL